MNLVIFALIPLILSIGIVPALSFDFVPTAEGYGSGQKPDPRVCGEKLCSEIPGGRDAWENQNISDSKVTSEENNYVASPKKQMKNGVAAADVQCIEHLKLMIRPNGQAACIDKNNILKLESWRWIVRITTDINKLNGLNWFEPENRNLGFRHMDKLVPFPVEISKGTGPVHEFGSDPQDLSKISIEYFGEKVTLDEYLQKSHTDAFLVLKGNDIVYEKYLRMDQNERHGTQSISKTVVTSLLGNYVQNGSVDVDKKMKEYIPDIGSGFAEATLQQVLDMDVSYNFDYDFANPNADIYDYEIAVGFKMDEENKYPKGHREYIKTEITSDDVMGIGVSQYKDPNTDISAWVLEDITGKKYYDLFEENIYQHLGAEQDAMVVTDVQGNAFAAGGWQMTLRDLARYSTIWMNDGIAPDGERVIPIEWIDELRDQSKGVPYKGFEEKNVRYHNQITSDGTFLAHAGWAGQFMYADPENDISYVMFSSLTAPTGVTPEDAQALYEVGWALSEYFSQ
jgi:CubicO group peptidase (beta-lactamase class C family)